MRQVTHTQLKRATIVPADWRQHWPGWVIYGAGAWSLLYGLLGLYWALGGAGFPFGPASDRSARLSILANVQAASAAPVIAVLGLLGVVAAWLMVRNWGQGLWRWVLLGFVWLLAVTLALLIPDYRVLVAAAYAPIFLVGAPFGWPPVSFLYAVPWPVINQFLCILGGCLWGGAALVYQRTSQGACAYCGRAAETARWTTPAAAARWGKWATYIAVLIPVLYAATRWAWALGIPLAVIPASLVAILVTTAGLMFVRLVIAGNVGVVVPALDINLGENWATLAPELLWPLWGVALGAATLAYYYRRRGRCPHCGRG